MDKSAMPNLPGVGAVTDTLEFMKGLWGGVKMPGVSLPGMVMPTLSVAEIDKQITDLKAVESWLTVNMNMLHGTIKALEVQSATISALQSMSANFSAAMQPATAKSTPPAEAAAPFSSPFKPVPPAPVAPAFEPATASPKAKDEAIAPIPMANPAAWWNMLQDQFKQAVANAAVPIATSMAKPSEAAKAGKAGAKSPPKAAKSAAAAPRRKVAPKS